MARGERSFRVRAVALLSLGLALPLAAQLDDACVVSALNRTVPVRPDGVWVLPNIPAACRGSVPVWTFRGTPP